MDQEQQAAPLPPRDIPSGYAIVEQTIAGRSRWYPLRFGAFQVVSRGQTVWFADRADAVRYCWYDQAERERWTSRVSG
jgi:hypothetical protein